MIALDTNVLLRFLMRDDEAQFTKIARFLNTLELQNKQARVSLLVVLEMVWVLSHSYQLKRKQVIEGMRLLMTMPSLSFEHTEALQNLLVKAQNTTFDLSDLLIALHYQAEKNLPIVTFDKKAAKFEDFTLLT